MGYQPIMIMKRAAICTITGNEPYAALLLVDDQRAGARL
jgi:hypothetical protein